MQPSARREVFSGNMIRVEVADWPQGRREIVRHPGACAIVAITGDDQLVLVRQFRESVDRSPLEIPAGIRDVEGEAEAECAARELLEETGFRAVDVRPLGVFYSSPGFTDEQFHIFEGRAEPTARAPEEGVDVVTMPFVDALDAVKRGLIVDSKTALGVLLATAARAGAGFAPGGRRAT